MKTSNIAEPTQDQSLYNNSPEPIPEGLELPDNNQEIASLTDNKNGISIELRSMVISSLTLFDKILKERKIIIKENGGSKRNSYT